MIFGLKIYKPNGHVTEKLAATYCAPEKWIQLERIAFEYICAKQNHITMRIKSSIHGEFQSDDCHIYPACALQSPSLAAIHLPFSGINEQARAMWHHGK